MQEVSYTTHKSGEELLMQAVHIEAEIRRLQEQLHHLEKTLKNIQQQCKHHYENNTSHEKCVKCLKVNALYY